MGVACHYVWKGGYDMDRATIKYTVGASNDLATVIGTGSTPAAALAEVTAKVALMRGVAVSGSATSEIATGSLPAFSAATNDARHAILTLKKTGLPAHTVRIPNMRYDKGVANDQTGLIDFTDGDIQAFAAAYVDSDGNNGYSCVRGQYLLT
jgi:hypothetical protein